MMWLSIFIFGFQLFQSQSFNRKNRNFLKSSYKNDLIITHTNGAIITRNRNIQCVISSSSSGGIISESVPSHALPEGWSAQNIPPKLLRSRLSLHEMHTAACDLNQWRIALRKGLTPETIYCWPFDPLFSEIVSVFWKHEVPQLVHKHRELLEPVVSTVIDLALTYQSRVDEREKRIEQQKQEAYAERREQYYEDVAFDADIEALHVLTEEEQADIRASLLRSFESKWSPALTCLACLDSVLGPLPAGVIDQLEEDTNMGGGGGGSGGFGLFDGFWEHQGWAEMRALQRKIEAMPELRKLMGSLGRRASAQGRQKMRFPPMIAVQSGAMGVAKNPTVPSDFEGLRLSGDINGMLFRDTALLGGSDQLRLLFLAKYASQGLLTYDRSDWEDQVSRPKTRPKHLTRLPTLPGGPIIIAIDTSWSMAGPRETLAKAVVLESARLAHRTKRDCYVLAFSGRGDLAECDLQLSTDKQGIERLLDFLACGFKGGTDVVSPLRRAMQLLAERDQWASADVLLVTDGELSMPPLDEDTSAALEAMKRDRDLRVHGLLIGRKESVPLNMICENSQGENRVHDFLNNYDEMTALLAARDTTQNMRGPSTATTVTAPTMSGSSARNDNKVEAQQKDGGGVGVGIGIGKRDAATVSAVGSRRLGTSRLYSTRLYATDTDTDTVGIGGDHIGARVEAELRNILAKSPPTGHQSPDTTLSTTSSGPVSETNGTRHGIVARVLTSLQAGLIERSAEVRLLLLAVLSREHILLVGPPGTGKSELARRLSLLSEGRFFERLLTRYTQPEELFGPFSLRALERDQYLRNIAGFLPTADTAFIDEIFKANSAILNTLLTVLNERRFDNGYQRIDVPLVALIGASNELPDSDDLEALYDRFIFRKLVSSISDDNIKTLLQQDSLSTDIDKEVRDAVNTTGFSVFAQECLAESVAGRVAIPEPVLDILVRLRAYLRDEATPAVFCSDRRLKKATQVLAVAAAAMGRSHVTLSDTLLLQYILWSKPGDEDTLREWLYRNLVSQGESLTVTYIVEAAVARMKEQLSAADRDGLATERRSIETVFMPLAAQKVHFFEGLLAELKGEGVDLNLWLDETDASALRLQLAPQAEQLAYEFRALLTRLCKLQLAIDDYLSGLISAEEAEARVQPYHNDGTSWGGALSSDDVDDDDEFSASDLTLSKKEAQRRFTGEQFKRWKKQVKSQ